MTKQLWINLPVKDLNQSKDFFAQLGFSFNPHLANNKEMAGLIVGENNSMVMLCVEPLFNSFTGNNSVDTKQGTEVLFSIDAQSREEVDEIAQKVVNAGGTLYGKPGEKDGWMYGCGFSDLDGHRWSVLYMDMSQMPKR